MKKEKKKLNPTQNVILETNVELLVLFNIQVEMHQHISTLYY